MVQRPFTLDTVATRSTLSVPRPQFERWLVLSIVVSLAGGQLFNGWILRCVAFFAFLYIGFSLWRNSDVLRVNAPYLVVGTLVVVYVCVVAVFSRYPYEAAREVALVGFNFATGLAVLYLGRRDDCDARKIATYWSYMFALTAIIAIPEILFDVHLPLAKTAEAELLLYNQELVERRFASVTFGNLNSFNTVILFSAPFVIFNALAPGARVLFAWPVMLAMYFLALSNGSRACIFFSLASIAVLTLRALKGRSVVTWVAIVGAGILLIGPAYQYFEVARLRVAGEGFEDLGRLSLLIAGWEMLQDSNLFGVGPGNFIPRIESEYDLVVSSPHNFLLEVGAQYGVFIFALLLLYVSRTAIRAYRFGSVSVPAFALLFIMAFLFGSVTDSGYLDSALPWIFLFSVAKMTRPNSSLQSD